MGMFEDQFGGLGEQKKQKRQNKHDYCADRETPNTYPPQQVPVTQTQPVQRTCRQSAQYTPRNLIPSPIPKILRVIAWVLIALCSLAAVATLVAGIFGQNYLIYHWYISILVAVGCLLAGFLSALPFFYWAKKLELVEEIRNLLRKGG